MCNIWGPSQPSHAHAQTLHHTRVGTSLCAATFTDTTWQHVIVPPPCAPAPPRPSPPAPPVPPPLPARQVHRTVQGLAALLITIGFILPFTTFEAGQGEAGSEGGPEDPLLEAHERLAVALMVLLGLHICVAVARPKPEHPKRR